MVLLNVLSRLFIGGLKAAAWDIFWFLFTIKLFFFFGKLLSFHLESGVLQWQSKALNISDIMYLQNTNPKNHGIIMREGAIM